MTERTPRNPYVGQKFNMHLDDAIQESASTIAKTMTEVRGKPISKAAIIREAIAIGYPILMQRLNEEIAAAR